MSYGIYIKKKEKEKQERRQKRRIKSVEDTMFIVVINKNYVNVLENALRQVW